MKPKVVIIDLDGRSNDDCECWVGKEEYEQDLADGTLNDCWKCRGSGEIEWDDNACSNQSMIMCWACRGTGENK